MKYKAIATFSLFVMLASASAEEATVTYKGVALGASVSEYKAKLPDHRCTDSGDSCRYSFELMCLRSGNFNECVQRNTFGGERVNMVIARFRDDRLTYLNLRMSSASVSEVMEALRQKLGGPTRSSDEPFQTQGGLKAANLELVWESERLLLTVRRHSGRLNEGSVTLTTSAELSALDAEMSQKAKTAAKDL